MRVYELINALACFAGHENVYLVEGELELHADGAPVCTLEEGAPEADPKFSSSSASDAALAAQLEAADFAGAEPSGSGGTFTVADVKAIALAKVEAGQDAALAEGGDIGGGEPGGGGE